MRLMSWITSSEHFPTVRVFLPLVSFYLSFLARDHYAKSLGAGTSEFDVQITHLFLSLFLIAAALFLILVSNVPVWARTVCCLSILGYFAVLMGSAKVDRKTNLTRSLLNLLATSMVLLAASVGLTIYGCVKFPVFHRRRLGVPIGLWMAVFAVGTMSLFYTSRLLWFYVAWPKGIHDHLYSSEGIRATSDDPAGTLSPPYACLINTPFPYLSALPDQALNFWAGGLHCPSKVGDLATLRWDPVSVSVLVQLRCDGTQAPVGVTVNPTNIEQSLNEPWYEERMFTEWLEHAKKAAKTPKVLFMSHKPVQLSDVEIELPANADWIEVRCGVQRRIMPVVAPKFMTFRPHDMKKSVADWKALRPNVIMLLFDAVSRPQAHRALPKTFALLEQFAPGLVHAKEEKTAPVYGYLQNRVKMDAFEFMRYHSLGHATAHNAPRMTRGMATCDPDEVASPFKSDYGASPCNNDFETHPFLWQQFKGAGYATMFNVAECDDYLSALNAPFRASGSFIHKFVDHYLSPMYCDEEYDGAERSNFQGAYGLTRRCMGGASVFDISMEAVSQALDHYSTSLTPLFAYVHLMEGHEGTGEIIKSVDAALVAWLEKTMVQYGHNTIFVLASDHGSHMGPNYLVTRAGSLEHRLPLWVTAFPKSYVDHRNIRATLLDNTRRLVTADDFHATFADIAATAAGKPYVANGRLGKSLAAETVGDRPCNAVGIKRNCLCSPSVVP
eukprot:ANDGO_06256.mRNA.1 hypothetical protein DICPUDRAFT_50727